MAAHGKRRRRGADHGEHVDERWLLTYADLITLLMALFMVLFSISSVNKSKFETLQRTLSEAFSGKVLPGGRSIQASGGSNNVRTPSVEQPFSALQPFAGGAADSKDRKQAAAAEDRALRALEKRIEEIARRQGLAGKVTARVGDDGLHVRVLTDDLLFDSGQATPRPESLGVLSKLGGVLASERRHPVLVEGHTDTVPVSGPYPSNWELSGARAASVVRAFIGTGVNPHRLTASGKAYLDAVAPNSTRGGRSLNRRVEILLPRLVAPTAAEKKTTVLTP